MKKPSQMEDNMIAPNENSCGDCRKDVSHKLHIDFIMEVILHLISKE
jgi:nitrate/TMAO reductase-like tetraheme cytochrome c subunit